MAEPEYACTRDGLDRGEHVFYDKRAGLERYRQTVGNLGASVAVRDLDDTRSEIVALSFWEGLSSIEAFAGTPVDQARYFPGDDAYLLTRPEKLIHYVLTSLRSKEVFR